MVRTAPYQPFQPAEYRTRFERARQLLRDHDFTACILVAPEHHYFFGGYDTWVSVNSLQAMVFTAGEDEPTLLLRDVDLSLALESTWIEDIRTYNLVRESFPALVSEILEGKGVSGGRVAVELASYALPAGPGMAIADRLDKIQLVDATRLLGDLRLIKSPREIEFIRQAGKCAGHGLEAMRRGLTNDVTEIELAGEIEYAMRRAGGDYWAIPTELASGVRSAGGHATPRDRVIAQGDLVHAEFAGVSHRYHAVAIQTLALGDPPPAARELYDIGLASLRAGLAAARPGVAVGEVEEASLLPLRSHGLEQAAEMRFGYGVGIAYPPIWLETLQIARGFDYVLEPGMVFVLHSCLQLPEENLGLIQGGTWLMTERGLEIVAGAGDCELTVA